MMTRFGKDSEIAKAFEPLDIFAQMPREAIAAIASLAARSWAYRGQTILEEGEEGGELLILLEGRVGVCLESINPSVEVAINKLNAGAILGEMSLLEGGPRSATVIALERCLLAQIPSEKLNELFEQHPDWGLIFMRNLAISLSSRLRAMNRRILNMTRVRYF
jgi:CRP/FNR family cyclic AMP-dependent transcriptional regulator